MLSKTRQKEGALIREDAFFQVLRGVRSLESLDRDVPLTKVWWSWPFALNVVQVCVNSKVNSVIQELSVRKHSVRLEKGIPVFQD